MTYDHADGDHYFNSVLNRIKSKSIFRWYKNKQHNDLDRCSSDSLQVNIGDLADAEELKKDLNLSKKSNSENIIEDDHILNGFRLRSKEILTLLSQNENLCHYGERDTGRKLLAIAAEVGWYEGVIFLLNHAVNVNETDYENRTALMESLASSNTNIMKVLIKKPECNVDIQTRTGHTAAHYAVMMNV